jgi:transposase InsO family protein
MVSSLHEWYEYPIGQACELAGLPRSTYHYHSHKADESQLVCDLKEVAGQHVTYGTRRVRSQLRRSPYRYCLNRKRVQRIMRGEGLLRPVKRRKYRTTDSDHPYPRYANLVEELEITSPEQVWVCDITYIRLGAGFVFLAIVMDVFTRLIRGWQMSKAIDQELTLVALRMALNDHVSQIHHSDQGVQYAAHEYTDLLKEHQIQISMAAVGEAEENGYAERLMRTIKEEEVDLSEYRDFADAKIQIGRFIEDVYNHKRIHSSLGYLTPAEFEAAWLAAEPEAGTP